MAGKEEGRKTVVVRHSICQSVINSLVSVYVIKFVQFIPTQKYVLNAWKASFFCLVKRRDVQIT